MVRSQLISQAMSCQAWQAVAYGQQGLKCVFGGGVVSWSRRFATVTPSSSSVDGSSSSAGAEQQQQQQHQPPVYAACVLERLPIVKTPPPAEEAEVQAQLLLLQLQSNQLKQYPRLDAKQRDAAGQAAPEVVDAGQVSTAADAIGAVNTMKRRLQDKLVLLVKANSNNLAAAAAAGGKEGGKAGKKAGGSSGSSSWTFPHTAHQAGETIRQAAERALRETIGLSQVYFVGNAPMAHLDIGSSGGSSSSSRSSSSSSSSSSSDGSSSAGSATTGSGGSSGSSAPSTAPNKRVFFHLAQVVNDPWDVQLLDGTASDFAWVTKEELDQYITDTQLLQLARKML